MAAFLVKNVNFTTIIKKIGGQFKQVCKNAQLYQTSSFNFIRKRRATTVAIPDDFISFVSIRRYKCYHFALETFAEHRDSEQGFIF